MNVPAFGERDAHQTMRGRNQIGRQPVFAKARAYAVPNRRAEIARAPIVRQQNDFAHRRAFERERNDFGETDVWKRSVNEDEVGARRGDELKGLRRIRRAPDEAQFAV